HQRDLTTEDTEQHRERGRDGERLRLSFYVNISGYANISESSSEKNVLCSRWITSGTSSSSITNVRLISEAPCEIMRIFLSASSRKTRAAIPGVSRRFSPTRQTMALRPSYFTSASLARSAASAGMA